LRESAVSTLDDLLGWDIVPPTILRPAKDIDFKDNRFGGRPGPGDADFVSVQTWKRGTTPWADASRKELDNIPYQEIWKVAILDVITDNIDRHGQNLLIRADGKHLWAIDNESAFDGFGEISAGYTPIRSQYIQNSLLAQQAPESLLKDLKSLTEEDIRAAVAGIDVKNPHHNGYEFKPATPGYPDPAQLVMDRIAEIVRTKKIDHRFMGGMTTYP